MNFRTTYILFGAVAVLLLVFLLFLAFGPRGDTEDFVLRSLRESVTKSDKLPDLKKAIERVEIERIQPKAEPLVFVRTSDGWKLEQPYEARIEPAVIDRIVNDLIDAKINKKADISTKLNTLGLDSPTAVLTLRKGKDAYRLSLGNVTGTGASGVVFALASDRGKEPIAVNLQNLEGIFRANAGEATTAGEALKDITDYRPRNLLADGSPIAWDVVQTVRIKGSGKELGLQRDTEGGWRFLVPESYGLADLEGDPTATGPAAENIAGVKPLLTALAGLRLPDNADVIEGVSDFSKYGLEPGKEVLRVETDRRSGGAGDTVAFGAKADEKGEKLYARFNNERFVCKLPAKTLEPIRKVLQNPSVLRDRNLAALSLVAIDAIDIKLRGEKRLELRRVGTPPTWKVFEEGSDAYDDASPAAVSQLLAKLTERRQVKDFPETPPDDKAFGLDDPVVELGIWQNGIIPEKKEEAKSTDAKDDKTDKKPAAIKRPTLKGEPTVRLKFGKKEKDLVYVRRLVGPVSTRVAVPEGTLTVAARPATDYLDPTLPSFHPLNVAKMQFRRGTEKIELTLSQDDPKNPAWRLVLPAAVAGRIANQDLVTRCIVSLVSLQPTKQVARKATDAELERFGLKNPRVEATITLREPSDVFVYQFGAETEDKKNYYAKLGNRDRIFQVAKTVVDGLLSGELQDPTVFRLDPAKVKALKITGWKDQTHKPVTLELVRQSATEWTVKQPADYKLDSAKVEQFLAQQLNLIRAESFLPHKGPPTPDMKLDVQADALAIEVTVDGEKEPYTVTLGAVGKDNKSYFATSNKAPGTIFLLYKDKFAPVRTGPSFFQKK